MMEYIQGFSTQLNDFLKLYPTLKIVKETNNELVLAGKVNIFCRAKQFSLCKDYNIRVVFFKDLSILPRVFELDDEIDSSYEHKYQDGGLCLETDAAIWFNFIDGFDISEWFDKYVKSYFVSYEYKKKYGSYPFGDRRHGVDGIIDYYGELFKIKDDNAVQLIMYHIVSNDYRGHQPCPCGSGKRTRDCHGNEMLRFYNDHRLKKILTEDLAQIYYSKRQEMEERKMLDAYTG